MVINRQLLRPKLKPRTAQTFVASIFIAIDVIFNRQIFVPSQHGCFNSSFFGDIL